MKGIWKIFPYFFHDVFSFVFNRRSLNPSFFPYLAVQPAKLHPNKTINTFKLIFSFGENISWIIYLNFIFYSMKFESLFFFIFGSVPRLKN